MNRKSLPFRLAAKVGIIHKIASHQRGQAGKRTEIPANPEAFPWPDSLSDPTGFYHQCVAYFDAHLPPALKEHRAYFSQQKRGFGEDAFHVMWSLLMHRFQPQNFLEIGVYRGQVLSLVSLLQREIGIEGTVTGIGPFERIGDSASVVDYGHCEDWLEDTLINFDQFGLPKPNLLKALSTDPEATALIASREWDMIYIDGNHDYEVVLQDWENCSQSVKVGGVIVLDDSGLESGFHAPLFASEGFPGPSKIANSADQDSKFKEILQVGHNRAFQRLE